jgi:hypothetical protein
MIGGSGNRLAKIARTKSSPDIDAMTSMGTTPYSIGCSPDLSPMISRPATSSSLGPDPGIHHSSEGCIAGSSPSNDGCNYARFRYSPVGEATAVPLKQATVLKAVVVF